MPEQRLDIMDGTLVMMVVGGASAGVLVRGCHVNGHVVVGRIARQRGHRRRLLLFLLRLGRDSGRALVAARGGEDSGAGVRCTAQQARCRGSRS